MGSGREGSSKLRYVSTYFLSFIHLTVLSACRNVSSTKPASDGAYDYTHARTDSRRSSFGLLLGIIIMIYLKWTFFSGLDNNVGNPVIPLQLMTTTCEAKHPSSSSCTSIGMSKFQAQTCSPLVTVPPSFEFSITGQLFSSSNFLHIALYLFQAVTNNTVVCKALSMKARVEYVNYVRVRRMSSTYVLYFP